MDQRRFEKRPRIPRSTVQSEQWEDATASLADLLPASTLSYRKAWDWSLVLKALDIPHSARRSGFGWRIHVPGSRLAEAVEQIRQYENENIARVAPAHGPPAGFETGWTTFFVMALAFLFNQVSANQIDAFNLWAIPWEELGLSDSTLVRRGQWWRAVTALTLHADPAHFVSNAVIGGVFVYLLSREIKSGPAWLLFVLSGLAGNLLNAWIRGPGHLSLGASTSVFGVVAAISAYRMAMNRRLDLKNTLLPAATGMAILAFLGTAGERTDVLAHLFGFAAGLPLGAVAGLAVKSMGPPGELVNRLCAIFAAYIPFYAWARALEGFEPSTMKLW